MVRLRLISYKSRNIAKYFKLFEFERVNSSITKKHGKTFSNILFFFSNS